MMPRMNAMLSIRRRVFGMSQSAFAEAIGVNQSTVSRWENDELQPSLDEMARIRDQGAKHRKDWSDGWFFEVAPEQPATLSGKAA